MNIFFACMFYMFLYLAIFKSIHFVTDVSRMFLNKKGTVSAIDISTTAILITATTFFGNMM